MCVRNTTVAWTVPGDDGASQKTTVGPSEQGNETHLAIKRYREMFISKEAVSAEDVIDTKQSDVGEEETDIYVALREALGPHFRSATQQASIFLKLEELADKFPVVGMKEWDNLDAQERYFWLKKAFPSWSDLDIVNIDASITSVRRSRSRHGDADMEMKIRSVLREGTCELLPALDRAHTHNVAALVFKRRE